MKYVNATDILPDKLLKELQKYVEGEVLYVPTSNSRKKWGSGSGAKSYYEKRNEEIRLKYRQHKSLDSLADEYGLAVETIRKIVYT